MSEASFSAAPAGEEPLAEPPPTWLAVARAAKGFMPDDEGLALYRAGLEAGRSGLAQLVEIGTYCAKSAVYLGAAARQSGTVLFSVDHHRGSLELQPGWPHHDPEVVDPATGLTDTLPWARRTLAAAGLESDVVLVVGESSTVARSWQAPLSLLFIDGGHGEEVAWDDFRSWSPKVCTRWHARHPRRVRRPPRRRPGPLRHLLRGPGLRAVRRGGGLGSLRFLHVDRDSS